MIVQPKRSTLSRRWLAPLALAAPLLALAVGPAARADDCDVRGTVERPAEDAVVTNQPVIISGWAADISADSGTGISEVRVALDADPDQGGVAVPALYGWQRPDVADLLSAPRFAASGLALAWDPTGVSPGRHTLYIQAHSSCGWITVTRTVLVAGQGAAGAANPTPARPAAAGAATPATTAPRTTGAGPTTPGGATSPAASGASAPAPGGPSVALTPTPTPAVPAAPRTQ
ncbi:MAG TPA: hypothetical protein VK066_04730 [Chloroflexota bacterium]|nr:hypothetical protein [Chloroflexota bacterium]